MTNLHDWPMLFQMYANEQRFRPPVPAGEQRHVLMSHTHLFRAPNENVIATYTRISFFSSSLPHQR